MKNVSMEDRISVLKGELDVAKRALEHCGAMLSYLGRLERERAGTVSKNQSKSGEFKKTAQCGEYITAPDESCVE